MGASKKVLIVEGGEGGYSEKVSADNALLVGGDATVGKAPVVQSDGSVEWEDTGAASSRWEADGDNHIAPTSGKRIKAEIADVDASGFNKNLSADDDDVQKALVTIDQMDAGGGAGGMSANKMTAKLLFGGI